MISNQRARSPPQPNCSIKTIIITNKLRLIKISNSKPLQSPANSQKPSSPLQNQNYLSKTGNKSGKGRGNTPKK